MRIEFSVKITGLDNVINLQWQTLMLRSKIEINISVKEFSEGYMNLISNIINDIGKGNTSFDRRQKRKISKKIKSMRYKTIKRRFRNLFKYRYIFRWLNGKIQRFSKKFYRKIKLESLKMHLNLGAGDAQITAYLYALAWQVIGLGLAKMYKTIIASGDNVQIEVEPDFVQTVWNCTFNCILNLKISHIIFTAYKALLLILKSRRTINIWMNIQ